MQSAPQVHAPAHPSKPWSSWLLRRDVLLRIGLVLLICLYARTLRFDFVYDDLMIPVSPWVQSWHGILDAFKSDVFGAQGQAGTVYYRPIASALVVLVARLTAATPPWYHLSAILVDLALYIVSFFFGRAFFEDDVLAALTSVLFILHPAHVEPTAWIGAALCDGQAAIYYFAVLLCYLRWWKTRGIAWMAGSWACFALAMFTKETMIVLPALILLHLVMVSEPGERLRRAVTIITPYAIIAGIYALARHAVIKPLPAARNVIQPHLTWVNLWTAPLASWWYLKRLVFPSGMSVIYEPVSVDSPSIGNFFFPLAGIVALIAIGWWAWRRTRSPRLVFFYAWFVFALAPVVVLAPALTFHDRYLELAIYPFCALLAFAVLWFAKRTTGQRTASVVACILIALYSVSTWHETGFWFDSMTLWTRAVRISPRSINARLELARLYSSKNLPAALDVLEDGLRYMPRSPGLWRYQGLLLYNAGEYDRSRASLLKAIEVSEAYDKAGKPVPPDVTYGKAVAAFYIGQIAMIQDKPAEADSWLRQALSIDPDNVDYARAMASNLRREGRTAEAQHAQERFEELVQASSGKARR